MTFPFASPWVLGMGRAHAALGSPGAASPAALTTSESWRLGRLPWARHRQVTVAAAGLLP